MRQDISDYKMQMQTQRDNIVSRRGEDAEFKEKLGKKNRELAETMEELQVDFLYCGALMNCYNIYCFGQVSVFLNSWRIIHGKRQLIYDICRNLFASYQNSHQCYEMYFRSYSFHKSEMIIFLGSAEILVFSCRAFEEDFLGFYHHSSSPPRSQIVIFDKGNFIAFSFYKAVLNN